MSGVKWWLAFLGYALCWSVGASFAYAMFPFHIAMREFGNLSSWGIKNMKRMVAYLPILALAVLLPASVFGAGAPGAAAAAAAASAAAMSSTAAVIAGQSTRYYGPQGQYQGRSSTNTANPSQQSLYDSHGNYLGRAMTKPDGSVKVYDNHGGFKGSSLPGRTYTPPERK